MVQLQSRTGALSAYLYPHCSSCSPICTQVSKTELTQAFLHLSYMQASKFEFMQPYPHESSALRLMRTFLHARVQIWFMQPHSHLKIHLNLCKLLRTQVSILQSVPPSARKQPHLNLCSAFSCTQVSTFILMQPPQHACTHS